MAASPSLHAEALAAHAWPFEEARKLLARIEKRKVERDVIFETGYGPSGLPHIGTFGEVARTTWVRRAFSLLSNAKTRLLAFSDDMDGLRKVPDNVPNKEMLRSHLGKSLTSIPDPFGTHESFGAHNNARLKAFLDRFGFEYEFLSSTDCYKSGRFDEALLTVLARFEKVRDIVLPTLGPERRATYSPFLPISPKTGVVLQVPILEWDAERGTIVFEEDGRKEEVPVTGGHAKLQWKADWAMRWLALGVDYEMSGKDLISSVELSSKIVRAIGGAPPEGFNYELFLDDRGQKISKSKGNGLSVDEWLTYGTQESLALFMFQKPRAAKKLYFDSIPKAVDEYISLLEQYRANQPADRLESPIWHIHGGHPPAERYPVGFALLLNLVSASNAHNREVLWGFIRAYAPGAAPQDNPGIDKLVECAIKYYDDFVKPQKRYRAPSDKERAALTDLAEKLRAFAGERDGEKVQFEVYEVGKRHGFEPLRDWFKALYEVLFGQTAGPRFGSFAVLFGCAETAALIERALAGEFATAA
ncbi:MAG: lysine--tRNA ligase [Alphaproteobacteria bacterium]|nr:lysine--tRNA ligase [Alphaproteobacteria bacterium]MDE2629804.1 lysine--tRNA ligase [Alphaproteobacteria bacterium]